MSRLYSARSCGDAPDHGGCAKGTQGGGNRPTVVKPAVYIRLRHQQSDTALQHCRWSRESKPQQMFVINKSGSWLYLQTFICRYPFLRSLRVWVRQGGSIKAWRATQARQERNDTNTSDWYIRQIVSTVYCRQQTVLSGPNLVADMACGGIQ